MRIVSLLLVLSTACSELHDQDGAFREGDHASAGEAADPDQTQAQRERDADPGCGQPWCPITTTGAPSPRVRHTALWTGTEMIVLWGDDDLFPFEDGARYDPRTDTWTPMSMAGAPEPRVFTTAIWTGSEMIVWGGGRHFGDKFNDGGRYDPITDSWRPISSEGAPAARWFHSAVWTGTEMIVWGGSANDLSYHRDGGRYDPVADTWEPLLVGSPLPPPEREAHSAVWTGSEMIVWGGYNLHAPGQLLAEGGSYDPVLDRWRPISSVGEPSRRDLHTMLWTGSEMIVWGGRTQPPGPRAGAYDPVSDEWRTLDSGDPGGTLDHSAVWTGTEMIVWGGWPNDGTSQVDTGARFEPTSGTWTELPREGAPSARGDHSAVWTGTEMIVWGGWYFGDEDALGDGARWIAPEQAQAQAR
jgi:hypothetical protein